MSDSKHTPGPIDPEAHTLLHYTTQWAGEALVWLTNTTDSRAAFEFKQANHQLWPDAVLRDGLPAFGASGQIVPGLHPVFVPRHPNATPSAGRRDAIAKAAT